MERSKSRSNHVPITGLETWRKVSVQPIQSTRYISAKPALKRPASAVQSRLWPPLSKVVSCKLEKIFHPPSTRDCYCTTSVDGVKNAVSISPCGVMRDSLWE